MSPVAAVKFTNSRRDFSLPVCRAARFQALNLTFDLQL
ncbi:hypothetical protein CAMRE0001_1588 [Campylobacter rectus RM3267]|uniref:Uncharacterized protein n=1 Tax=Campylobacter rectus RM3267 TaxID=553218 RepID=B9CZ15_CAMRE|nr:hypothetical protein CAMRE0001_1588 [Campylobacter rectus RM3267]